MLELKCIRSDIYFNGIESANAYDVKYTFITDSGLSGIGRCQLYGFHVISANNGWAMAFAGALIVFAGLVVLSTAISQLHKILMFWEKKHPEFRNNHKAPENDEPENSPTPVVSKEFPTNLTEVALLYNPLIKEIGETFYLADLYLIAKKNNFPHPHITFTAFRESNILISHGDGVFTWNLQTENKESEKG